EVYASLMSAEESLASYLSGAKEDDSSATTATDTSGATATATEGAAADTGSIASLLSKDKASAGADTGQLSRAEAQKKYPIQSLLYVPEDLSRIPSPTIGYVAKKDTAKLNKYLNLDVVKNKFPNNMKFVYGAESKKDRRNPN